MATKISNTWFVNTPPRSAESIDDQDPKNLDIPKESDAIVRINEAHPDLGTIVNLPRAEIVSCNQNKSWSATLRSAQLNPPQKVLKQANESIDPLSTSYVEHSSDEDILRSLEGKYLLPSELAPEILLNLLRNENKQNLTPGLILLSGKTSSGKSKLADAIVHGLLAQALPKSGASFWPGVNNNLKIKSEDPPISDGDFVHLLTFESSDWNPIFKEDDPYTLAASKGFAYTNRHLLKDFGPLDPSKTESEQMAHNLRIGLMSNALRQKPSITYVFESRTDAELEACLQFAATGHMVVTTCHAGSLTETFSRLFKIAGATTSSQRRDVAEKLVSVLYCSMFTETLEKDGQGIKECTFNLPTIWRNSPAAMDSLTKDGLRSIVLQVMNENKAALTPPFAMGRSYVLNELLKSEELKEMVDRCLPSSTDLKMGFNINWRESLRSELQALALKADLNDR